MNVTEFFKIKKNKWSTMAETFNTTVVTKMKLKLLELNHFAKSYAKFHLKNTYRLINQLLNYNLILVRGIPHKVGIIFNFENKTLTLQEISISMKPPNCTAKEFFVIKESCAIRDAAKRIKQILDAEYKRISLKSIVVNLNHFKDKHKNSLLEILKNIKKCLMEP